MTYDIAIIGAGPGGYVSAIRAGQLGTSVALIEKDFLGGTCLNRGCIPTKAMLASVHYLENVKQAKNFGVELSDISFNLDTVYARQKKIVSQMRKGLEQLLKSYSGISIIKGEASICSPHKILVSGEEDQEIETKNIIIATGSFCASLGNIEVDHDLIINSDDALNLTEFPESIVVIGGGAIGVEWSRIFSASGVDVTIVEMLDRIAPACDKDASNVALRFFKRSKVKVKTGVRVDDVQKLENEVKITLSNGEVITTDKVLLAVGRRPNTCIKGLEDAGVSLDGRFIKTNDFMQTSVPSIYAIGDVAGKLPLAHVASHEGVVAVEKILGHDVDPVDYSCVPFVIYGSPEMAAVGLTQEEAEANSIEFETNTFHYAANGKAIAESETAGIVKTIIDSKSQKILGVHIVGANASDMVHLGVIAIKNNLTKSDFKETIFAHPTLSESFYESIMNLHVPDKSKLLKQRR